MAFETATVGKESADGEPVVFAYLLQGGWVGLQLAQAGETFGQQRFLVVEIEPVDVGGFSNEGVGVG